MTRQTQQCRLLSYSNISSTAKVFQMMSFEIKIIDAHSVLASSYNHSPTFPCNFEHTQVISPGFKSLNSVWTVFNPMKFGVLNMPLNSITENCFLGRH